MPDYFSTASRQGYMSAKKIHGKSNLSATRRECLLRASGLAGLAISLQACGSTAGEEQPSRKEAARLEISITADNDMNVDTKGAGAPLLLRVYELKSATLFQDADFFALQDHDKTLLGAELLAFDQFMMRPGETREIRRQANSGTTAIGIFAGYRDLPNAVWRLTHTMAAAPTAHWYRAVVPSAKARLALRLTNRALLLTDANARPPIAPVQHAVETASTPARPVKPVKSPPRAPATGIPLSLSQP
jgi:type VI secretion system protein VasD